MNMNEKMFSFAVAAIALLKPASGAAISVMIGLNMKKIKSFLKSIPARGWAAVLLCLALNCSVYFGTRLLPAGTVYHDISSPIDHRIPLVPPMIVVYILAYCTWGINYLLIAREGGEIARRVFTGAYVAKLICLVCFLVFPTAMQRPEPTGSDVFSALTRLIYRLDAPNNLLPSIHCLESWLCWRGLFGAKRVSRGYKAFSLIFALLVFASTVLVRQHCLIDVPAGVLVGEIGLLASRLIWRKGSAK